tara:strand:- start:359 stop:796 length:438 start_codon:yes stop_codon:yes gene_type:complete
MKQWTFALLLLALIPSHFGCRQTSDLQKVIVHGKVSYDGEPIVNGQIYFYPTQDTQGPVSGAPIVDGSYLAEAKDGVPVGTHLVKIEGFRVNGGGGGDMLSNPGTGLPDQYIPAQYNSATTLEVVIPGDSRKLTKDFELAAVKHE